jgi:cytochrome c oxidase cbb3-type subunit 3
LEHDELRPGSVDRTRGPAWVLAGLAALVGIAGLVVWITESADEPVPAAIADDPVLLAGREVYRARCLSCHGEAGRGDGPIAGNLAGPPVGDLTDARWKHGDRPEQVRRVLENGVRDTAMPGWKGMISDRQIDAVLAYVLHLGGRSAPPRASVIPAKGKRLP